ncbi:hypothetical protein Hypma_014202 [Hypsizygus marmoreus]|uniref:Uncharacterized protein n=1 Tax=Hypsizygus marmoreus TaxID=39966 RepID=A0A369JFH6_HYPMA|nr:hypothetical protein Hypma_014202 [Hypsizygus marmoreus]
MDHLHICSSLSPELDLQTISPLETLVSTNGQISVMSSTSLYKHNVCMLIVLEYCSWTSIVAMCHVDRAGRKRAQILIRARIANLMKPFFPVKARASFFSMLLSTKGAIYGHLPWCLFSTFIKLDGETRPHNIDVAVPKDSLEKWADYLDDVGYYIQEDIEPLHCHRNAADLSIRRRCPMNAKFTITVTQSLTDSVLPIILSSDVTTYMSVITASHLFSFYPRLTASATALGCFDQLPARHGFTYCRLSVFHTSSTEHWTEPCGEACPAKWRLTRGLPGVGVLQWECSMLPQRKQCHIGSVQVEPTNSQDGKTVDLLQLRVPSLTTDASEEFRTSMFKWRTGSQCLNEACVYNNLRVSVFRN